MDFGKVSFSILFFLMLFLVPFVTQCGGVNSVYFDGRNCIEGVNTSSTGAEIYQLSCVNCHNPLANSTKKNSSAALISSAISGNKGGMGFLACLSSAQIQSISEALKSP